ncbi:hypothetical protein QQ020_06055 [Fulvivirgaceae bacterium BMA12]|uniref:Kazal-like domain-containing protein n=1 Tax=Agaribacillus aureus TaxID=3051825 RepID=A0ABT8L1J8_9BACT|nr:hypothetical protein [Fulvivirgaceae bacterium BMA12]
MKRMLVVVALLTILASKFYYVIAHNNHSGANKSGDCTCLDYDAPVCVVTFSGRVVAFPNTCQALRSGFTTRQLVSCDETGTVNINAEE